MTTYPSRYAAKKAAKHLLTRLTGDATFTVSPKGFRDFMVQFTVTSDADAEIIRNAGHRAQVA